MESVAASPFPLISQVLDALERMGVHLARLARLPKKRRAEVRTILNDTYKLLDAALIMVIGAVTRVIDRGNRNRRDEFEALLDNLPWEKDWLERTRDFSMSGSIRDLHSEMQRVPRRLFDKRALEDWQTLEALVSQLMHDEIGLAEEITRRLVAVSKLAVEAKRSEEGFARAMTDLREARSAFDAVREQLIRDNARLLAAV